MHPTRAFDRHAAVAGSEKFDLDGRKVGASINGDLLALGKGTTERNAIVAAPCFRNGGLEQAVAQS